MILTLRVANRTQAEQDLLALLHQEQQRNASKQQPELPDLPPELFGLPAPLSTPPSEVDLGSLWASAPQPAVASAEDPLSSLWAVSQTQKEGVDLSALWSTPTTASEPDLESLWSTSEAPTSAEVDGDALSQLFMSSDAVAQAQMTGQDFDFSSGDLPPSFQGRRQGSEPFNIEFDADFDTDAPTPPRTGRFRIDQGPPLRPPFNRAVSATDGQVVSQRGTDGRFGRVAATQPRVPASPPPSRQPEPPRPANTQTKYDVLRKGGLDL